MRVLITGAYGTCGTALIDHLYGKEAYDFTLLNRSDRPDDHPYGGYETFLANVHDYDAIRPAFDDQDAVVHLAADPSTGASWESILENNIIGTYNVIEAAREAGVESVIFASSNHAVGMVETEGSPELYAENAGVVIDHDYPDRPDSYYGVSKCFGEHLGRYYVENHDFPRRFYSLRICNVAPAERDDPVDYADHLEEEGLEPGTEEFRRRMNRKKAMWHSRRDLAHQVDRCLRDDSVTFDIFYGVSDNARRWFDLEHGRATIGYRPQDDGDERGV